MLSLLPMVLGAAFAGQPATVSFSCRAEPLGRLVQDLSKATGLALSVSRPCANDVLVVHAENVDVTRLLSEIAKVDAGTWAPAAGGFIFTLDRVARNEEAREERAGRAERIESRLLAELKSVIDSEEARRKNLAAEKAANAREKAEKNLPPRIAGFVDFSDVDDEDVTWEESDVLQVLAAVDPNRLVLRAGQKVVLSTEPNSMQSTLSSRANRILAQLVHKHDIAARRFISQMQAELQQGKNPSPDIPQIGLPAGSAILEGYGKADLALEASTTTGPVEAALNFYDPDGNPILEVNTRFVTDPGRRSLPAAGQASSAQTMTAVKHSGKSAKILALPAELAVAEKMGTGYRHAADLRAVEQLLLETEVNDPLSFVVTDNLFSLSETLGKPLVAVVPDDALPGLLVKSTKPDSVAEFVSELEAGDSMIKVEADGWLEIKPASPDTARRDRIDRAALGKLLRAAESKGVPNLDDIAAYAANSPQPFTNAVSMEYMTLFAPSMLNRLDEDPGNWSMYRIYGQLSADSKRDLAAGARLPISALDVSQRSDLADIVYGARPRLSLPTENWNVSARYAQEGFHTEATEVLPDGVPDRGFLQLSFSDEPCFVPVDPVTEILGVYDIETVGEIAAGELTYLPSWLDPNHPIEEFRLGSHQTYSLGFVLGQGVQLEGVLIENHVGKDSEIVSLDSLPADIKAIVDEKARQQNRVPERPTPVQSGPPPNR